MQRFKQITLSKNSINDFYRYEIFNGLTLFVNTTRRFKTVTVKSFIHRELNEQATLGSLLESVLQRGSRGYENMRKIQEFLDLHYGATFHNDVTKIGENLLITSTISCLNDRFTIKGDGVISDSIDFLSEMMLNPMKENNLLKRDYVEEEKNNLIKFLKAQMNDRFNYALLRCISLMCRNERFGINENGDIDRVNGITVEQLTAYHNLVLKESPIYIFVSGNVNPDKIAKKIHHSYKKLSNREKLLVPPKTESNVNVDQIREISENMNIDQAKLIMGYRTGITLENEDVFSLSVFNGIFGAFPHSRLFTIVREKEGLAYLIYSFFERSKGLLFVIAGINSEDYSKTIDIISRQVADIHQGNISDEEIQNSKKLLVNAVLARDETSASKINGFMEGLLNQKNRTTSEIISKIEQISKDDVSRISSKIKLDTVYLLRK